MLLQLTACQREVTVGHELASVDGQGGEAASTGGADGTTQGGATQGGATQGGASSPLWQADHDRGSLDEWLADDQGWVYTQGSGELGVSERHRHSGGYALRASIATEDGAMHQAVIGRDVELETGRYGAWYYFPEPPETDYWVIMKLSNGRSVDRFDIDVHAPSGQPPRLRLYEHGHDWISEPAATALPLARWVHVEALYRSSPGDDGRLTVLQDGEVVLDTGPRATADDARVSFVVGSVSWWIAGGTYELFIDDARIDAAAWPFEL